MVRKTYSTLVAVALAAIVMVGCGPEDVSDVTSTWTEKEGEVQTKLAGVQAKNQELQTRLTNVTVANPADSTMVTERAALETMLQANMAKVTEIDAKLKEHGAKRDQMAQAGNRAEYEAGLKAAETEYAAATAALDEIEKQNNDIASRLDNLSKPAATTNGTDTTAGMNNTNGTPGTDGTNMKKDTAVLVDDSKKTDEKPAESGK